MMSVRVRRLRGFALLTFIGLLLTHVLWAPLLYDYLDISTPPQPADVIVILGGGSANRAEYAAMLFHQGYAARILVSGVGVGVKRDVDRLLKRDVPERVLLLNTEATEGTWDEAQQVLALLRQKEVGSALIVTDGGHIRRASATYARVQQEKPVRVTLTFVAAPPTFPPDRWWLSERGVFLVPIEYLKIAFYLVRYGVWSF